MVRKIPHGRVVSYGQLGRFLSRPVSGLIVGRWMAQAPHDIPWWRVIAANRQLVLHKRSPEMGAAQAQHLYSEGVRTDGLQLLTADPMLSDEELIELIGE